MWWLLLLPIAVLFGLAVAAASCYMASGRGLVAWVRRHRLAVLSTGLAASLVSLVFLELGPGLRGPALRALVVLLAAQVACLLLYSAYWVRYVLRRASRA